MAGGTQKREHEMVPNFGYLFWPISAKNIRECWKTRVTWKWTAHLIDKARVKNKQPLLINIDETSIPLMFAHGKGNIMVLNGRRAWQVAPRMRIAHEHNRVNFTHLATICNVPAIQPLLPQIIFVGASNLRVGDWNRICETLPNNVYLKRMPSGWNSSNQHKVFLRLLRAILEPFMETYQPILFFDTAPAHMKPEVLAELPTLGIWYVIIPPRMTWLLQPCDTHVFQKFKLYMKTRFQDELLHRPGRLPIEYMIGLLVKAIRHVLQRFVWQLAFDETGLTGNHQLVSKYIKHHLEYDVLEDFSTDCPTMDEIKINWPRGRRVPIDVVMNSLADADGYDADEEIE